MPPEPRRPDHLLLAAVRGETVERPPVWAMRQAGRWDPEFNRLRGGLSFYEFSENVELAARASLLPRRFGVDAIILFYDITSLPVAMGQPFVLRPGVGPVPDRPVRTLADLEALDAEPDPERYRHIRDLLRLVKADLDGALPVLVFAGAPLTTATYCINTGKDLAATRRFAAEQPRLGRPARPADDGHRRLPPHAGPRGRRRLPAVRLLGRDARPRRVRPLAQPRHRAVFAAAAGAPRSSSSRSARIWNG